MKKITLRKSGLAATGLILITSFGCLSGCRSAPVQMPNWPWERTESYEPTPRAEHSESVISTPSEPAPAPPEPEFQGHPGDATRVPPAPAPMPDEQETPEIFFPGSTEPLPAPVEETQGSTKKSMNGSKQSRTRKILRGHMPLVDANESAEELLVPSPSLSGPSPKVEASRGIRRTRFQ